jgi:hypothetical protein
MSTKD